MNILTTQNLKFIDNYLKNSEIVYDDIRMELIDHIASAVEEQMRVENTDFYDAFKNYMILNKKTLLKNFAGGGFKSFEPIRIFSKYLLKRNSIVFAFLFFLGIYFFQYQLDKTYFIEEFHTYWFSFFFLFAIAHFIFFHFIKKKRFFVLEQSFLVLFFINYLIIPISQLIDVNKVTQVFWVDVSILFISIVFLSFYGNSIQKYYKKKHIWN